MKMEKILLAGATGYLGGYILEELLRRQYPTRVVVRNPKKLKAIDHHSTNILMAELTQPTSLVECCKGIDVVISTVGITRQKDGLTYMDVDYQANKNLLTEAIKHDVRKFIYVSVLDGQKLKNLKICEAKERFADELKKSGLDYCIIRPNGYFSDMTEFYSMAQKGRVYLFGNGTFKTNPIHGKDLANICIDAIATEEKEICAGGPDTLTHNQIAEMAFSELGKRTKISYIPEWVRKCVLSLLRTVTSSKFYGPIEFFMTVLSMDMVAPEYGVHSLKAYFDSLHRNKSSKV